MVILFHAPPMSRTSSVLVKLRTALDVSAIFITANIAARDTSQETASSNLRQGGNVSQARHWYL
jgi:hypothetical protein